MKNKYAEKILLEIEKGYDLISAKFNETRKHFWKDLEFIGDYAKDGDDVLDFGCGNGRLLELFSEKNIRYWGVDVSQKLINVAKSRYYSNRVEFAKINSSQTSLPFQDNFFNAVYSIAVFHHFPSKEYRKKIAEELYRVTKPGGYIIITVWNLWQRKYFKNILKNWMEKLFFRIKLGWNDCHISFRDNWGNDFQRYHHAWTKNELKKIFEQAGFRIEKCKNLDKRNIICIGKK